MDSQTSEQLEVERWRMKKLLKSLQNARGNGTSMISLILPPKDQISRASKLLLEEYGTASNIKSRVNRLSVLGAITSAQQRLKLINKVPENGLALYTGTILEDTGKERKVCYAIEPMKPINTSLYLCDSKFHVDDLINSLEDEYKFGFVIMDGHGCLFATVSGNYKEIKQNISVDLPKKHGRGGQSSVRFARLRMEKRHNYLRRVSEISTQVFITNNKINVDRLILGGCADFKNDLFQSDFFDGRLKSKVVKIVDLSYGGENGLNQAIELSEEVLKDVKLVKEKKVIKMFFDEVVSGSGKVCFGVKETEECFSVGCLDVLIVYENMTVRRREGDGDREGEWTEEGEGELLTDWLAENCRKLNFSVVFVSDRSQEGNQFISGFGGIGGILRYKMELGGGETEVEDFSDAEIF